jgi:hypothetical protein
MLRLFQLHALSVLEPVISQFLHRFCLCLDPFTSDHGTAFSLLWKHSIYHFILTECQVSEPVIIRTNPRLVLSPSREYSLKKQNCPRNKPWRPVGLWDTEDPILSRHSAHMVRLSALRTGLALLSRNIIFLLLIIISVRGWVILRAVVRLEGLGKLKKKSMTLGLWTRDLTACSIAPQPSTLPCAPLHRVQSQSEYEKWLATDWTTEEAGFEYP